VGTALVTDNGDSDPNTFAVTFSNYVIECDAFPLTVNTDPTVNAELLIRFLETSPSLAYEVELTLAGPEPRGISVQLPSEEGGIVLDVTAPGGALLFDLDGDRAGLRHGGNVHLAGTLRLEDRSQPLLLVTELALEYAYDDGLIPKLSDWPSGSYEIAGYGGTGGFGFSGATAGSPLDVFFDGLGGAAFVSEERTCVGNLVTFENPCEDDN
jgi:hypothetical protein